VALTATAVSGWIHDALAIVRARGRPVRRNALQGDLLVAPDVYFSYATIAFWALALALYGIRVAIRGGFHSERVARFGGSALIGRGAMDMTYWVIEPVVRGLARLGITPNSLTWSALVSGFGAGVALGLGWFGVGCLLATISTVTDMLDGQVARLTNTSNDRGELLDAAVDRYTEFALFAGIAFALRDSWWQLALALASLHASFMVSYATAKAEALKVTPPRGLVRRHERGTYAIIGIGLTPVFGPTCVANGLPYTSATLLALAIIAVVGNAAAVTRFVRIGQALR
jgi:CDP-diacylglycerol---glycerol-3-phosphate 3-phosphatidyltransferase